MPCSAERKLNAFWIRSGKTSVETLLSKSTFETTLVTEADLR